MKPTPSNVPLPENAEAELRHIARKCDLVDAMTLRQIADWIEKLRESMR